MPLFERVMAGSDEDLANRVRAVLRMPQVLRPKPVMPTQSIDAKVMAERSIKAGYLKDAVKYLEVAHEADPGDFDVMRQLGWGYNALHQDQMAVRWFALARKSPDPEIASDADHAWHNLRRSTEPVQITAWFYPIYSTRWQDFFGYAQVKAEVRTKWRVVPLCQRSLCGRYAGGHGTDVAFGKLVHPWSWSADGTVARVDRMVRGGVAISYVKSHMLPDYRGGVNIARARGHSLGAESGGWFCRYYGRRCFHQPLWQ